MLGGWSQRCACQNKGVSRQPLFVRKRGCGSAQFGGRQSGGAGSCSRKACVRSTGRSAPGEWKPDPRLLGCNPGGNQAWALRRCCAECGHQETGGISVTCSRELCRGKCPSGSHPGPKQRLSQGGGSFSVSGPSAAAASSSEEVTQCGQTLAAWLRLLSGSPWEAAKQGHVFSANIEVSSRVCG